MSNYATALTWALKSGNDELRSVAVKQVEGIFQAYGGNLLKASRELKISHRTMCRWIASDSELRDHLARCRVQV